MIPPLLHVEDLHVDFSTRRGVVKAVRGVSLDLLPGATLGVVGESGSGKSVTAYAVTRLLDRAGRIARGRILFRGQDLTRASEGDMRALRGGAISMVFQNPRAALNPIRSVGKQLMDALGAHVDLSGWERRERALSLLRDVLIRDPERRFDAFPHELSGGMCQRVMIAMAIACDPALLIADEPTTGLDVTTQKTVMDLLARLTAERHMGLILITHDLGLAAQYCGEVAVMQDGEVVERADAATLFRAPHHPYTQRLVAASPTPRSTVEELVGEPPRPAEPLRAQSPGTPLLLEVRDLVKRYDDFAAVDGVSFAIRPGESLGLVGESGSGKSTISRLICRLIDRTEGTVLFDGEDIGGIPARDFHANALRREIQIVFQDPHDSLNPRFNAFDCIAHPLRRMLGMKDGAALTARVGECAERAGLPRDLLTRFPHQLSGGQKARIGIARAIAAKPKLLVLDEPTAALDVSVQAVILKLLDDLRRQEGLAFLFVSHDLNVVRMMCGRTIVLQQGRIVEEGDSRALFAAPRADYTRDLLAAIPHFDPAPAMAG
ncbi:ABC transporter ATP-binding protein [Roseomonas sp. CAU 1739]|uniref:ABC transporter ATP-binding protein n=1 Tax=Roseomonas sp. CAU 1739 TaxID=3140364 RepID=UPI00325A929A